MISSCWSFSFSSLKIFAYSSYDLFKSSILLFCALLTSALISSFMAFICSLTITPLFFASAIRLFLSFSSCAIVLLKPSSIILILEDAISSSMRSVCSLRSLPSFLVCAILSCVALWLVLLYVPIPYFFCNSCCCLPRSFIAFISSSAAALASAAFSASSFQKLCHFPPC